MKKALLFVVILLTTLSMAYAQEKIVGITTKVVNPTGELGDPHKTPDSQTGTTQIEYRPFAQDGKTWYCQVGGIKENYYDNHISGDTLIGGEYWKKVYNIPGLRRFYYAAVCDVDKKVYAIAKGSNKPRLLYDFSLEKGDIVRCGIEGNMFGCLLEKGEQPDTLLGFEFRAYLKVERIDTITECNQKHRVFVLTLLDAYKYPLCDINGFIRNNVIWVEGVGSYSGPFLPWTPLPSYHYTSRSCSVNKTYIFGYKMDYEPNYVEWDDEEWGDDEEWDEGVDETANANISYHMFNQSDTFYNLQGRRLQQQPQHGFYIVNGMKFVK